MSKYRLTDDELTNECYKYSINQAQAVGFWDGERVGEKRLIPLLESKDALLRECRDTFKAFLLGVDEKHHIVGVINKIIERISKEIDH